MSHDKALYKSTVTPTLTVTQVSLDTRVLFRKSRRLGCRHKTPVTSASVEHEHVEHAFSRSRLSVRLHLARIKAKFHFASWFEAGSKLVGDRFETKFNYAIWFESGRRPASNQLRTS